MSNAANFRPVLSFSLPYHPDSTRLFAAMADAPWAVFLDSGPRDIPGARLGRFDILACAPRLTLVEDPQGATLRSADGEILAVTEDAFAVLQEQLKVAATPVEPDLPFSGGALGYFTYELGQESRFQRGSDQPLLALGFYDWAVVVDHSRQKTQLVSRAGEPAQSAARAWLARVQNALTTEAQAVPRAPLQVTGPLEIQPDAAGYATAFARIQDYIRNGDCYQVNYAQRFRVPVAGDPWAAYQALRCVNPAPYAAYLHTPFGAVLSCSPEQFLALDGAQVRTRPIKGTRQRMPDPVLDADAAHALQASPKDRAENLMIVDLLRNDLGRVCQPGSIAVPELFAVESFARVHHLVSTVQGRLAPGRTAVDVLQVALPGGSITGAPKRRAMEIIHELEGVPRGIYCGAIGWLGYNGNMDTNIAIRTLTWRNGWLEFWAGGGIVADSDRHHEYQECFAKAAAILDFLHAHGLDPVG